MVKYRMKHWYDQLVSLKEDSGINHPVLLNEIKNLENGGVITNDASALIDLIHSYPVFKRYMEMMESGIYKIYYWMTETIKNRTTIDHIINGRFVELSASIRTEPDSVLKFLSDDLDFVNVVEQTWDRASKHILSDYDFKEVGFFDFYQKVAGDDQDRTWVARKIYDANFVGTLINVALQVDEDTALQMISEVLDVAAKSDKAKRFITTTNRLSGSVNYRFIVALIRNYMPDFYNTYSLLF